MKKSAPPEREISIVVHCGFGAAGAESGQLSLTDFFISYNREDRSWAEWIAWHLEGSGYTTVLQAWDFRPGFNFVLEMDRALSSAERIILLLSQNYLDAVFTQAEWAAGFANDPISTKGRLVPIRMASCAATGLLAQIIYIDLVGLDSEAASKALTEGVARVRAKPSASPAFPGFRREPDFPRALSKVWQPPFGRNPFFTGRDAILQRIHDTLRTSGASILCQAVAGLGGIGKTQTALEYAHRHAAEYSFVFWINASRRETLIADFDSVAAELQLTTAGSSDVIATVAAVRRWLADNSGWLIVFDNADVPDMLDAFFPTRGQGHILITSRARELGAAGIATPLELDAMRRVSSTLRHPA